MKLADKKTMLISFINTMLSDKNDEYYLVQPELNGNVKINAGNGKSKKYQYINGDICIPYSTLKDEYKTNLKVLKMPYIYTYIRKEYMSDNAINKINDSEDDSKKFFENNPDVENALNNLIEALSRAKY